MATIALTNVPDDQGPFSEGAWKFLENTEGDGLWEMVIMGDGTYAAHFHDDGEVIPLRDMAYNHTLGLFRPSLFPDERDESYS